MPVDFTATDNLDGTVTVTVSGSGSALNEVQMVPIDNQWGDLLAWTSYGARVGDGQVSFAVTPGVYMIAVVSDGNWTPPRQMHVIGTRVAILESLLRATEARVRLMTLPGIAVSDRQAYLVVDEINVRDFPRPAVWIAPADAEQVVTGGVPLGLDGIVYPILVGISAPANRSQSDRESLLLCREVIRQGLLSQRLTARMIGADWSGYVTGVRPLEIVSRTWWLANVFVSAAIFTVLVHEIRGM